MSDTAPPPAGPIKPRGGSARGGRPKIPADELRTATIGVRVSAAEYDALRAKAEKMNMSPAQWLREAALTRRLPSPPVPEANRAQYAELGKLAGNLNQLAHHANEGMRVSVPSDLLHATLAEISRLRLQLIGLQGAAPPESGS